MRDVLVRRALGEHAGLQISWGSGSFREEFETDSPTLAAWLLELPSPINEEALRASAIERLGVPRDEAEHLIEALRSYGLLTEERDVITQGEELWRLLEWDDALIFHRATRRSQWLHDYPPNPTVMTWFYHDRPVVPESPRPNVESARGDEAISLPPPSRLIEARDAIDALHGRRTHRRFQGATINLEEISTVLHWAFRPLLDGGSRNYYTTQSSADGFRETVTPRPLSAFAVFDRGHPDQVPRLQNSAYVYDPEKHALVALPTQVAFDGISSLLCDQDFADGAPLLLVLAVNWSEYMWKYRTPYAYRMAHFDLGAFMQTALVAATAIGLRTFITPAVDDEVLTRILGADDSLSAPAYVVALGRVGSSATASAEHPADY